MNFIKVFVLIGIFSLINSQKVFRPNLPLGEYRTVFDKMYPCESTKNHLIKYHLYFSKRTLNITEIKGNITYLIPYDDTLTLDVNFSSWSLIGGWKPNSAIYVTKNACTNTKKVLGNAWYSVLKTLNVQSANCPVAAGTYSSTGLNLEELEDHNSPKVYFYGKYKLLFKIKNEEKKLIGCAVIELSLVRPWEKPI